jgi:hypothetical protein
VTCRFCRFGELETDKEGWMIRDGRFWCAFNPVWLEVDKDRHFCGRFQQRNVSEIANRRKYMLELEHSANKVQPELQKYRKLAKERFRKIQELKAKLKSRSAQQPGTASTQGK